MNRLRPLLPVAGPWAVVIALTIVASFAFDAVGLPSPTLFGGLVGGLVPALVRDRPVAVPARVGMGAQAVVGVTIGTLVHLPTLRAVGEHWLPVLSVTLGSLLLSVGAGYVMRYQRGVDAVTGTFAMVAGGASGITVIARELGADDRLVAIVQYLRVLLIVTAMPLVTTLVFDPGPGVGRVTNSDPAPWAFGLAFTAACAIVGVPVAQRLRVPAGALLGPMLLAAVFTSADLAYGAQVPSLVENAAYALIGVAVGSRFTVASLRTVGRALPMALALIVAVVVGCAGLGVVLAHTAGVSDLDAYLATTPGGLYAVLATATDSGANATFVLAVQVIRLFVMLLSAPLLSWWLRRVAQSSVAAKA